MTQAVTLAQLGGADSPFFRNRIINGAMMIDQRNAGAAVTPANASYSLDRWISFQTTADKFSVQQQTSVVPTGFTHATKITSLSAYSVSSSDYYTFQQKLEGYNVADLEWGTANAKTITLSFWVRSSLTGTFGCSFFNPAGARSYPVTYSINSANTWEYKTLTLAGDTSGTWPKSNDTGIILAFTVGAGSSNVGTAGAWANGLILGPTGATSIVGTSGATLYITGVQLEVGTAATPFERRPYGTELQLCQRYYHFLGGDTAYQSINTCAYYSSTEAVGFFRHPVEMRVTPTIAKTGNWSCLGGGGVAGQNLNADQSGPKTTQLGFYGGNSGTTGQATTLRGANDLTLRVTFSAEM
jgi:hypothetical protein